MSRRASIENILRKRFPGASIAVEDESHRHKGHAGAQPEGGTHFSVMVISTEFEGLSRLARQRLVHEALDAEFKSGLHALSLKLFAPGES